MSGRKSKKEDPTRPRRNKDGTRKLLPWEVDCCYEFIRNGEQKRLAFAATYPRANKITKGSLYNASSRFFHRPEVKIFIADVKLKSHGDRQEAVAVKDKETVITVDRILTERARLAFFNMKRLFDKNGIRIPLNELPEDVAACVTQYDEEETVVHQGDKTSTSRKVKLKFADKNPSLTALEKFYGLKPDSKIDEEESSEEMSIPELESEMTSIIEEVIEFEEEVNEKRKDSQEDPVQKIH